MVNGENKKPGMQPGFLLQRADYRAASAAS